MEAIIGTEDFDSHSPPTLEIDVHGRPAPAWEAEHAGGIAQALAERGAEPPAEPLHLALIVHALEDGLLLQRILTPNEIADDIVVDAFELLINSWTALGRYP